MESILSILYCISIIFAGYGLGSFIIDKKFSVDYRSDKNILCFVLYSALGLGFLSFIHFCFGCIGGFNKPFIYILIGIMGVLALYGLFDVFKRLNKFIKSKPEKLKKPNFIAMVMLSVMVLGFVFCLLSALAPSISDDWDSLAYHLSAPKKYLAHGGFYYINYSSHTNFPMLQEILYITPIFLKIPVAGKLLHFFFGLLTCIITGFILSEHFIKGKDNYSVVFGSFMIFSMPIFLWLMTTAYIDVTFAFYGVLALYFILSYTKTKNIKDIILCGFACGFGASCKMLGCQYILIFALWIVLDDILPFKKGRKLTCIKPIVFFILSSVLVCACWYIKSIVLTGNPVYPFYYEIFGGKDWTQELADFYAANQAKFGVGHNLYSFITTPIWMTIDPGSFYDVPGLYVGAVLLMTFPAICLLYQVRKKNLLLLAISICLLYCIWFKLTHQSRYLIPMFCFASVFIPAVLSYINGGKLVKYTLCIIFIAVSFLGLIQMYNTAMLRLDVVTGSISKEAYLSEFFKPYDAYKYINKNLPKSVKIGLFGDTEGFYLDREFMWCDYGHNSLLSHNYKSPEELINDLRKNKITHIIVPFGKNPPTIGDRDFAEGTNKILFEAIDLGYLKTIYPDNMSSSRVFIFEL